MSRSVHGGRMAPLVFVAALAAAPVSAQDEAPPAAPAMTPEQQAMMDAWQKAAMPGEPHERLRYFVGEWDAKTRFWMSPDAPPAEHSGKAQYEMVLDGRHLRMDYQGEYAGQPFTGVAYMGYDNVAGKHYATWIDSMSTALFVGYGAYDAASDSYTIRGEVQDLMPPHAPIAYRQVTTLVDEDHHRFESYDTRDGEEVLTMRIDYTRAKP